MGLLELFILLVIGHAICDYPLQSSWMAQAKNPNIETIPGEKIWPFVLFSHTAIHAGAVLLITGMWFLAFVEWIAHTIIDYVKCKGYLTFNQDQSLHILTKVFIMVGYGVAKGII